MNNDIFRHLSGISGYSIGANITTVLARRTSADHGRHSHRHATVSRSSVRRASCTGIDNGSERRSFASADAYIRTEVCSLYIFLFLRINPSIAPQILDNPETLRKDVTTPTGCLSRTFACLASSGSSNVEN